MTNKAALLSSNLSIMHHTYTCMVGCDEQINAAFRDKHITLNQYDDFVAALSQMEDCVQASSHDYEEIKKLGDTAWALRNKVLDFEMASRNASAGWREEYPGGPKHQGAPYVAEHLQSFRKERTRGNSSRNQ